MGQQKLDQGSFSAARNSSAELRRIGRGIVNVDRLLMASFTSPDTSEDAVLMFDNGQRLHLTLTQDVPLSDLIVK